MNETRNERDANLEGFEGTPLEVGMEDLDDWDRRSLRRWTAMLILLLAAAIVALVRACA